MNFQPPLFRQKIIAGFLAILLLQTIVFGAEPPQRPGWKLTFDDEFHGQTLDPTKWTPADPWGRERNKELQAYVTNAFTVTNDVLSIRAERRAALYSGKTRAYTSGMMTTRGKFSQRYGRFEIRCRIPAGRGLWPAFWLLPDSEEWPPEIDILEFLDHEPRKLYMTLHFRDEKRALKSQGGNWVGPDFSKEFHEIALEWNPRGMTWFVDGVERCHADQANPPGKMYLLVNLAVGGDWPGPPDTNTPFPANFEVDYVRVYEAVN